MTNWLKISYNRNLLFVLFFLVTINVFAILSKNDLLLQVTKPLFVPLLFMYFLIKNKYMNGIMVSFLICFFLGDFSSVLFSNPFVVNLSNIFYCLSYLCLVYAAVSRIRIFNIDKVVGICLLLVLAINAYLMFELFAILQVEMRDTNQILLFSLKSIALLILAFLAFATYLNKDSIASIFFLATALCFAFADVFYYISNFYVHHWSFVIFDRLLHVAGLFFLFNYIIQYSRKRKKRLVLQNVPATEGVVI